MHILIATNNMHKLKEFREIFAGHRVDCPGDLGIVFDHDETGTTFFENSYGKAHSLWLALQGHDFPDGWPAILADDSGIAVPALGGEPGIYSARYGQVDGGPVMTDSDRNHLLLDRLRGEQHRRAYYVCCMVLLHTPERFVSVQETWEGFVTEELSKGTTGFGYDPLFWLPEQGCTVADLEPAQKAELSHRAKASLAMAALLGKK